MQFRDLVVVLPEVARPAARHQVPIRVVVVLREWLNVVQGHRRH